DELGDLELDLHVGAVVAVHGRCHVGGVAEHALDDGQLVDREAVFGVVQRHLLQGRLVDGEVVDVAVGGALAGARGGAVAVQRHAYRQRHERSSRDEDDVERDASAVVTHLCSPLGPASAGRGPGLTWMSTSKLRGWSGPAQGQTSRAGDPVRDGHAAPPRGASRHGRKATTETYASEFPATLGAWRLPRPHPFPAPSSGGRRATPSPRSSTRPRTPAPRRRRSPPTCRCRGRSWPRCSGAWPRRATSRTARGATAA